MTVRVLLVVGTVAGGAGQHVLNLAAGLVERGHGVTVACPTVVGERFDFAAHGARVERIEISERPSPTRDARSMRDLRRLTKLADVVHAHGVRAGALACLATKKTPVVVTLHNASPSSSGFSRVAFDTLQRVVAGQADAVLAVSSDLVNRARELGCSNPQLALVPAGTLSAPVREPADVRSEFGGDQLILVVGRLAEQKRIDLAVDVAAELATDHPESRWVVAGDGPERADLQSRIERQGAPVTLLGHRTDVPDLLRAADLVVSTASWEGQPVWLQEALQAGAAIVATDVGGTADVVGDGACLVPFGDSAALRSAISRLLGDEADRTALKQRASARADALPTASDALKQVESTYRSLLPNSIA
ncbi:glycosyltransferase [Calidifontibacter terrae]